MIDPFDNDYQSQQIGQLIIENQTDKITIYGDIDITKNEAGLTQAKQLQQLFDSIVKAMVDAKNNDEKSFKNTNNEPMSKPKIVKNPFS